ncbi:hypothetical protein ACQR35_12505 [Pseudarthrobacter sp. J1738]|uniref:hypothetical protein n=1 Tax=unclassified Pseudarthrobacter TaxID=2647000 RepID=UPI003D2DD6CE
MSAGANYSFQSVVGNTARSLVGAAQAPSRRQRTPLSLVQSTPRRKRAPFVVFCFAVLAVALLGVLVLNIQVSKGQYQLVELKAEQSSLNKQNQELTQQVQNFEAPQNLAAKASQLGMVASTVQGQIDLKTLAVSGKAAPAVKDDNNKGAIIAAPAVAGQLAVVPPAPAQEAIENRAAAAEQTAATPEAVATPAAKAPEAKAPVVLNGGTIPAPAQKTPGQ